MKIGRRLLMLIVIVGLLLVPLIAMQFTQEVDWSFFDFAIAGILLFSVAIILDYVFRKVKKRYWKIILSVGILVLFLLLWAELAVGILGTPISGN